jgi:MYXO-CTERM domain-containing protein
MIAKGMLVAVAVLAASGCVFEGQELGTGQDEQELIGPGGHIAAPDEEPAVVALVTGGGSVLCTGTLVSPSVIITAAHCVDMFGSDPNVSAFFGWNVEADGKRVAIKAKQQHTGWTGNLGGVAHDIAMLLLSFPQDPELPMPLFRGNTNDYLNADLKRVGFGIYDRDTGALDGKKRVGTTVLHTVNSGADTFLGGDQDLSTCNGDSGGPSFVQVDGTWTQIGVHSFGYDSPERCAAPNNGDTRVDLYVNDFVLPWIQENDPVCKQDFVCARIGCEADPDCTPCGPDGTCETNCELPDIDCHPAQVGDICQTDGQCQNADGKCVWWEGDPESKFCSRECDPAADDCPAGMTCRNFATFGNVCYYDEAPSGILGDSCSEATDCGSYICEQGTCVNPCDLSAGIVCPTNYECSSIDNGANYYCHSTGGGGGGGGCSTSGGSGGAWLLLVGLGLLVARRRRS